MDLLNEVTFIGSVYDKTTGLQYVNVRFYQPATGRFLSQDTYSGNAYEPWTQHLYSYVGNNPVNMVDPTGHEAEEVGMTGGQIGHLILDAIGFISLIPTPVTLAIGIAANAANAAWYAAEGDYGNAALNAAACIPVAGQAAKMAKAGVGALELATKGSSAAFKLSSAAMQEGKGAIQAVSVASKGGSEVLNPKDIHFMQSSIKNQTGSYTVLDNIDALKNGTLKPKDLPTIKVWKDEAGKIWTLDHRRLASFKGAGLNSISVQWATPQEIADQMWKMTTKNGGTSIKLKLGNGVCVKISDSLIR